MIVYIAFVLVGLALLIETIKSLAEWRRSTPKSKNWDDMAKKAFAYGLFALVGNASLGIMMFGAISMVNHAGE
ncbi:MAG: hypothetical protein AAF127_08760 [Pseudomonadota bacterium]